MIVDDEDSLLELVKAILENEGLNVVPVRNGTECLERLKSLKPDLILMDMMMPVMSGRETTEKIRNNPKTKDIKIAFLTVARFSEIGKDLLKEIKVSDYITKPFDNEDLVARVKKLLK